MYGDGQITNFWVAFPYLALVNNVSQAWAMYCLILFYRATFEELAPIRPFYKFLTVKAVVFVSFWQGQAILLAVKYKIIVVKETWTDYDAADVATGLQEFAICVEMFFAAIAHAYAFRRARRSTPSGRSARRRRENSPITSPTCSTYETCTTTWSTSARATKMNSGRR